MILYFTIVLILVVLPADAHAWGPLTHVYLGTEVLGLASALPPIIYRTIKRHSEDFLYGNLMADSILWKRYLPEGQNSHSWQTGFGLMERTRSSQERAFVYGYLAHLATDTVVHTWAQRLPTHLTLELISDATVGRRYWFMALTINRTVQKRHDGFLERNLLSPLVSVRTSKRLFKGLVVLSGLTPKRLKRLPVFYNEAGLIKQLHQEALIRVLDVLEKGPYSRYTRVCPLPER